MNFRSIADIKKLNEQKTYGELSHFRPKRDFEPLNVRELRETLGGKGLLGHGVGNDDKEYLAKQLALAKQQLNVGRLQQAIALLEELKDGGYSHSDIFYMLGESHRRKGLVL